MCYNTFKLNLLRREYEKTVFNYIYAFWFYANS